MLGFCQVFKLMHPQVLKSGAVGQRGYGYHLGREDDLTAPGCGHEASDPINHGSKIVTRSIFGRASMDGHANTEFVDSGPWFGCQLALHGQGALQRPGFSAVKDSHHAVAGVLHMPAAPPFDASHKDLVMAIQDGAHGLAVILPKLGRTFDISV